MNMGEQNSKFNLEEILFCCIRVQRERICRELLFETASQKLSSELHRELLALAKIAELAVSGLQRVSSQPGGDRSSAEQDSQTEVRKEIKDLDPEDRRLLRETGEEIERILEQLKKNKEE